MRLAVAVILCVALASTVYAADGKIDIPPNPPTCPAGYRCLPISTYAQMTELKVRLEDEVANLKARKHLLGWHTTCGVGVAAFVDQNFDAKVIPAGFCGLGFGW